jgi:hypothetical protein
MESLIPPFLLFIIFVGTTYYVLIPFFSPVSVISEAGNPRATGLQLRKINLYRQLREIEFEHEMGITSPEDFERSRGDILKETKQVITALEQGATSESPVTEETSTVCPNCSEVVAPDAQFCGQCGTSLGQPCPSCGETVRHGDRFCASCGRGLIN